MFVLVWDNVRQWRKLVLPAAPPLQQPIVRGRFVCVHMVLCNPFDTPAIGIHERSSMPENP
jgi:hypothetical protein